jgi:hypothetical protein
MTRSVERVGVGDGRGLQVPAPYPRRGRTFLRLSVAMMLALCLLVLAPADWASLPDPSWIEGVYDDDQHGEVVALVAVVAGVVELLPVVDHAPVIRTESLSTDVSDVSSVRLPSWYGRSPPGMPSRTS